MIALGLFLSGTALGGALGQATGASLPVGSASAVAPLAQSTTRAESEQPQRWLWAGLTVTLALLASAAALLVRQRRALQRLAAGHAELQSQLRIQRSILDSMGEGVFVADAQGKLVLVNPAAERLIGIDFTSGQVGERSQRYGLYLPDQATPYPAAELPLARAVRGESCDDVEVFVANTALKEGRWLNVTARPLVDEAGQVHGGVAVVSDLTARKRAEEEVRTLNIDLERRVHMRTTELERSRNALQAIIENVPAAVYVKDLEGRYVRHNARLARVVGHEGESLVGKRDDDLIDSATAARVAAEDRQVAAEGQGLRAEHERPGPDGDVRTFQTHVFPLQDASGKTYAVGGISLDITDLKRAQRAAEAATRAKSEFLANMSHEIRTPMNAILGMSHLALQSGLDPRQSNYIQKVHASAKSLLGIINDILDFSKIEAGKLDLELIPFNLGDVMDNLGNMVGMKAQEKGLELLFVEPPHLPTALVGDPSRLSQVLLNLGNNAVKFTEQGEVVVSIEVMDHDSTSVQLRFVVRDTGVGMSDEQLHRLFQPFAQADASTSRRYGGTGLGLTICRHLVHLMGGEIEVVSAPGRGSSFQFSLRLGLQAETVALALTPLRDGLHGARVLIVDDNACAREVLVSMATALSLRPDAAVDGLDALRQVALADEGDDPYDLLLLDWQMPVMDGLECARRLAQRTGARHATPAVLMLTAFSRDEVLQRLDQQQLAVGALLAKPITPSTMLDACNAALGLSLSSPTRAALREEALDSHRASLRGAHVLLVEDNAINQELAVDLLSDAGVVVSVACDGQEALELIARQRFDCVLMDCQMPVMDGYTATRRLRQHPQWKTLPVIAMTANAMVGDRDKVLAAGMDDHIAKPIKVEEMFATLSRWVRPDARHTTGAPTATNAELPGVLPGLDLQAGLDGLEGDRRLYNRLLRMFRDREGDFPERFNSARAAGDMAAATRMAHDLKSEAGSLGMAPIQQAATALEEACQQPAEETRLDALLLDVSRRLAPVIEGLKSLGKLS
ncbi:MAG: response regulator [Vitreoscilla sp.]|nr:response regulator [Vitreoscilla sp.]